MQNLPASELVEKLREKWKEVPGTTQERTYSSDLLELPTSEFLQYWEGLYNDNCAGSGYSVRGWYHDLYTPLARTGGMWLEVGSGLGFDGTYFAGQGAHVTFFDLVESNLKVIERVCDIKGLKNVEFKVLESLDSIDSLPKFDVILAVGSLINAPYDFMCSERRLLANHLNMGGRWLELCYPKERWEREGSLEFSEWGKRTDGERTPWVEWYNREKLLNALLPHKFEVILDINFHNNDFNWFDFKKSVMP